MKPILLVMMVSARVIDPDYFPRVAHREDNKKTLVGLDHDIAATMAQGLCCNRKSNLQEDDHDSISYLLPMRKLSFLMVASQSSAFHCIPEKTEEGSSLIP